MAIRHYVLLATDGFVHLPPGPDILCPDDEARKEVYVFGFVGGLYRVDDTIINSDLNWENSAKWSTLQQMKGTATIPSPIIWGEVGDRIYVTLINLGMKERDDLLDFHTIHMHGAHVATQLDGFPESSFGVPIWNTLPPDQTPDYAPPAVTYYFNPDHPGTYMYHCHVEASEHVQMGMYGALVIYPSVESLKMAGIKQNKKGEWLLNGKKQHQIPETATNRNFAYNDINTYFDSEWLMLLSDLHTDWHDAVFANADFNPVDFRPNYWLVNGRAFPDTLLPHPQTPLPTVDPNLRQINYESYVNVKTGDKFLLRMINMGYAVVPWHIHGWHFTVIGKDTHVSPFLKIADLLSDHKEVHGVHEIRNENFTIGIASGETYDLLLTADDKRPQYRNYIVNDQDGFPSLCSQLNDLISFANAHPELVDSSPVFDIPTEPVNCSSPSTVNYVDICADLQGEDRFFPQFYPAHNHDDYKVTNDGTYPGGQLVLFQIDAPDLLAKNDDDCDCDCY
ncbi:multicopper oxidase domain-containing protein [Bacillus sp. REN10]|uniref:multicopper oxidase domain-containing protein n=1 Tax=Bacillus sp. REN10 TaxID=2782541 RepID=UPI00193AF39A|nr:multicopper oxidase domain-containing protein [Bacillus sp. REN10]